MYIWQSGVVYFDQILGDYAQKICVERKLLEGINQKTFNFDVFISFYPIFDPLQKGQFFVQA